MRCVVHGVVVENLGGNSYPLARWPWHRSCIRYPKVTKGSTDEHAVYGVMCVYQASVFTSLTSSVDC